LGFLKISHKFSAQFDRLIILSIIPESIYFPKIFLYGLEASAMVMLTPNAWKLFF